MVRATCEQAGADRMQCVDEFVRPYVQMIWDKYQRSSDKEEKVVLLASMANALFNGPEIAFTMVQEVVQIPCIEQVERTTMFTYEHIEYMDEGLMDNIVEQFDHLMGNNFVYMEEVEVDFVNDSPPPQQCPCQGHQG